VKASTKAANKRAAKARKQENEKAENARNQAEKARKQEEEKAEKALVTTC